jgi:hypothetical protein
MAQTADSGKRVRNSAVARTPDSVSRRSGPGVRNAGKYTSRTYPGMELSHDPNRIGLDQIEISRAANPHLILMNDWDGILQPLDGRDDRQAFTPPWLEQVEVGYSYNGFPFATRYSLGAAESLGQLPLERISLSSRGDTTPSTLGDGFQSNGRTAPSWKVLDVTRKSPELEEYANGLDERVLPELHQTLAYKVFATMMLIDRLKASPEEKKRGIVWLDDELHPRLANERPEIREALQDYAEHQGVPLYMPEVDPFVGITPRTVAEIAVRCREHSDRPLDLGDWLKDANPQWLLEESVRLDRSPVDRELRAAMPAALLQQLAPSTPSLSGP